MTSTDPRATVAQIRFPGQAAAPAGPVPLLPMYLMHHAVRRDLRTFAVAVARTPVADRRSWRALERRWTSFARVLHHHHAAEDEHLWPLLRQRVDAAGQATLDAMEAEHARIDPLLAACAAGITALAGGADETDRAALVRQLAATEERLGEHLDHEERDAMVLVQDHLDVAEWETIGARQDEALSWRDQRFALPWVLHDVPTDLLPTVTAFIGREGVVLWRLVLRRGFERRERAAFRYVPDHAG